jgi:peroxiredoxin
MNVIPLFNSDSLSAKRIAVFSINRIQSSPTLAHIKQIDQFYEQLVAAGIDEVYCVSFCDFVMFDFLAPKLSKKIKFFQDNDNVNLTAFQLALNKKGHPNFLKDYWLFACVFNNGQVEHYIEQPFEKKKINPDPKQNIYNAVGPEQLMAKLRS